MRKVYILTNFSGFLKSYSPIIVVGQQLNMLIRAGYSPVLITSNDWNPPEGTVFSSVETKRLPKVSTDDTEGEEVITSDVDKLVVALEEILEPNSVIITHDLIFLPDYTKHNIACRKVNIEGLSWIHVIHSATSPRMLIEERERYGKQYKEFLGEKFPNSIIAFPNSYDIPRVATNFSYEEDEVVELPHATDVTEGMSYLTKKLYDEKQLGRYDVLMVYPLRLDRGKNAEVNVRLIAACKQVGLSAHLIFCDFQSTGGDKVTYREELKGLAEELDAVECVTFLSEFDESASMEISHEIILELFTLSNIFCLPSKSETYSLIAQEAMMRGNLCILNHDFAPMRQIYGRNALYKPFGSNIGFDGYDGEINTEYEDINEYFRRLAVNLKYWLENDKVLRAKTWVRTKRNPDYVFEEFLEPLLTRSYDEDR